MPVVDLEDRVCQCAAVDRETIEDVIRTQSPASRRSPIIWVRPAVAAVVATRSRRSWRIYVLTAR